jgi:hypothetical protein
MGHVTGYTRLRNINETDAGLGFACRLDEVIEPEISSTNGRFLWARREVAAVTAVTGILLLAGGCGSAQGVHRRLGGQLTGRVSICRTVAGLCSLAAATVSILRVHGTTQGRPVARENAASGHFSFSLPPGKYFPSASDIRPKLAGARCISGEVVVTSDQVVPDGISCFPRVRQNASLSLKGKSR